MRMSAHGFERIAIELIARARWPSGTASCPYCAGTRVSVLARRLLYRCKNCDRTFSVRVGTIFQGSRTPLRHWLLAISLATLGPITSVTLARYLGIKQGAAWGILSALRFASPRRVHRFLSRLSCRYGSVTLRPLSSGADTGADRRGLSRRVPAEIPAANAILGSNSSLSGYRHCRDAASPSDIESSKTSCRNEPPRSYLCTGVTRRRG